MKNSGPEFNQIVCSSALCEVEENFKCLENAKFVEPEKKIYETAKGFMTECWLLYVIAMIIAEKM